MSNKKKFKKNEKIKKDKHYFKYILHKTESFQSEIAPISTREKNLKNKNRF